MTLIAASALDDVEPQINTSDGDGKFHFAIDRGGTFTDVFCRLPDGSEVVRKLLSEDPAHYPDAPTEGIRRVLQEFSPKDKALYVRSTKLPTHEIGSIRMGTTVATNALLERNGEAMAWITTKGFGDVLQIGTQARPNIFDLTCVKPSLLHQRIVEIKERLVLQQFAPEEWQKLYPSVVGVTGESVLVVQSPDLDQVRKDLERLKENGITALAICLLHAYVYPEHEIQIGILAREMGCFTQISLSHEVMPMVKLVSRGHTTSAAAYLTPKITQYVASFVQGFDDKLLENTWLQFMKSDGGLAPVNDFGGHQAILSGPAGGVVGYGKTIFPPSSKKDASSLSSGSGINPMPVIGFDMGGTSTDVSRYDGKHWEHVLETVTAGIAIQAPQLDIQTVAAGGGSRLFWRGSGLESLLVVGPESARAFPGPVCYRHEGGQLAVTDANVVLGRCIPKYFPSIFGPNEDEPLNVDAARAAFQALLDEHNALSPAESGIDSVEALAYGFLQVANEAMCRPIRNLTQMKGHDLAKHVLACFGGAGPQHACAMAQRLGMKKVFVHRYSGILSAYGLALADAVHETQEPTAEILGPGNKNGGGGEVSADGIGRLSHLEQTARQALIDQGYGADRIHVERFLNLRYDGTDTSIMIPENQTSPTATFAQDFEAVYQREYGFTLKGRDIWVDDYRVRAVVPGPIPPEPIISENVTPLPPLVPDDTTRAYFETGWYDEVPVYKMENLKPGHVVAGPSIIVQPISTVVLELNCHALVNDKCDLDITVGKTVDSVPFPADIAAAAGPDPVQLSIFAHRYMGIAEQMGRTLQRTAISVNMKERLDFSCALFTKNGGLVANAPHIPVHLGAMERAVCYQVEYWSENGEGIQEGDVLVSNHPQLAGGSHLPDITVITPVFYEGEIIFFVASRGHHADIGGIAPGSMPPYSQKLQDEGAMIVAFKLVRQGVFQEAGITELLQSPGKLGIPGNVGTRNLRDNLSDLRAQVAANTAGIRLLLELVQEYGLQQVQQYMVWIQQTAETAVRRLLKEFVLKQGSNTAHAIDYMDDGSPIELTITIDPDTGSATFDFTGTGPQVLSNHNAPPAVTYSAVIYALRCLVAQDIPLNQGCLAPIEFILPKYSLLHPSKDAGVVGGNVLTSQRIVDVVLRAFEACAASQGCMNNLSFGNDEFGYYETIAGGAGAGPTWDGTSGVHTHCTNTRITDPEILERRYPVMLHEFSIRHGSGGRGLHAGGDGVVRELEPLCPLTVSLLTERRTLRPYGMHGGESGASGRNLLLRPSGDTDNGDDTNIVVNMGGRCSRPMKVGERLRIETPGGGGYGPFESDTNEMRDTAGLVRTPDMRKTC
ncbi:hypothetical protein ACA910_006934 [Epithemia clementina (nom. ined.)]